MSLRIPPRKPAKKDNGFYWLIQILRFAGSSSSNPFLSSVSAVISHLEPNQLPAVVRKTRPPPARLPQKRRPRGLWAL